jgi:hypothetical protein
MTHITSYHEIEVLHNILPGLLKGGSKFRIVDLYKGENGSPVIYNTLTSYLIGEKFAERVAGDYFVLTTKGEYLAAYGTLDGFLHAAETVCSEADNRAGVDHLIPHFPYYGEFLLKPVPRKENSVIDPVEDLELAVRRLHEARIERLKNEFLQSVHNEQTIHYLIFNGFVINRHDLTQEKANGLLYRELTEKGRKLKGVGSIGAYEQADLAEQNNNIKRELLTDKLLNLNIDNVGIQKKQMRFNFWIAFGTSMAALAAAFPIAQKFIDVRMEMKATLIVFFFSAFLGAAFTLFIQEVIREKQN